MAIDLSKFIVTCEKLGRAKKYSVKFPYHQQLVDLIKKLPADDRSYDSQGKYWILTTQALFHFIKQFKGEETIHFEFAGVGGREIFVQQIKVILAKEKEKEEKIKDLEVKKEYWLKFKAELEENWEKYSEQVHKNLKEGVKLYWFQVVGTIFSNEVKNILLSLQMGCGKTIISIALCEMNKFKKVLVITPNSLKFNYFYEVQKFTKNSKAHIVNWKHNKYSINEAKYLIINYDFFNPKDKNKFDNKFKKLGINNIDCLILDECQFIENTKTNIYHNIKRTFTDEIFNNCDRRSLYMSGTPSKNRVSGMFSVLNFISKTDFPTKTFFLNTYCGMSYDPDSNFGAWKTDFTQTKYENLYYKISPYTYRKKLEDVIEDLPSKNIQKINLEFERRELEEYGKLEEGLINEFIKVESSNPITVLLRLRQYTSNLKFKHIIELIDSIVESGQKVVIFDSFKDSLRHLKEKYSSISVLHTGDVVPHERSEMVKQFQNDENCLIFLTTFSSGNYGITLTAAHLCILLTIPYSLSEFNQAPARLLRIGQKNNVNVYIPMMEESVDQMILESIENKQKEIAKVMDNEDYQKIEDESVVGEVIEKIKRKYYQP